MGGTLIVTTLRFNFISVNQFEPIVRRYYSTATTHGSLRYEKAQAILFGDGLEVVSRFDVAHDEKGQILLKKIFSVYQVRVGSRESGVQSR